MVYTFKLFTMEPCPSPQWNVSFWNYRSHMKKKFHFFHLFYCRDNPERIFELFVEIGKPSNDDEGKLFLFHLKLVIISNSGMSLITS